MSWTLRKDILFDKSFHAIAYFLPNETEKEKQMIKNGDDLIDLFGEFMIGYDESKQVSKKLFDEFKRLIDLNANYKIKWEINSKGELINENNQFICTFENLNSMYPKLINYLPEVYNAAQELVRNLSSTKGLDLKKIYDKICNFYDKALKDI